MPTTARSSSRQLATLVGSTPAIVAVRELIDRLAGGTEPVLVTGPAGSGKRVVAELLHQRSGRAARPFVAIDCAAPPDQLVGAIFGDGKAASGRAAAGRRGGVVAAEGATLFLSGVGDLPGDLQARLLGLLAPPERGGGRADTLADVRIIAATTVDLGAAAAAGRFHPDLAERLAAGTITVPALVNRADDIPALVAHFAAREARRGPPPAFTPDAFAYLARQPWPGNVRELRNLVARAAAIHGATPIDEPRAAVLLHGERRAVDRWLASAVAPLPMPNRRRPPPIVAVGEIVDLQTLLTEFEQTCLRDAFGHAAFGVAPSLDVPAGSLIDRLRIRAGARPRRIPRGDPAA